MVRAVRALLMAPCSSARALGHTEAYMGSMRRAFRAFQNPHTRRALFVGTPLLVGVFALAAVVGSREWLLLRATLVWLIGVSAVVQWRLAPLLEDLSPRRRLRPLERFGRHPLGAMVLGMVGVVPLAALGPLFDGRAASLGSRAAAWQVAGLVAAFVGGLAGLAVWDSVIGRAARRRRERTHVRDGDRAGRGAP